MTDAQTLTPMPMRWFGTLFNPTGTSSKLEFTRAWTLLFFIQVFIVVVIPFLAGVVGLVGGEGGGLGRFATYASPIVFTVTTFCSYIIHTRRLRDAAKPTWLAVLILVPLFIGFANFFGGVMQQASKYDELYQERQLYLTDFPAYQAQKDEEAKEAEEKAAELAKEAEERAAQEAERLGNLAACPADREDEEDNTEQSNGRGNWGNQGPSPENPLPDQTTFVLASNLGAIQGAVIPLSALLAIWSLVYVARSPLPSRYTYQRKGFARLYFSFKGRIGERQFWFGLLGWITLVGVGLIFAALTGLVANLAGEAVGGMISGIVTLIVALAAGWMLGAILVKRLHDFGKPAWRVLLPILAATLLGGLLFLAMILSGALAMMHCGAPEWLNYTQTAVILVLAVVFVLHFSWIAFSDPEATENEYGAPPKFLQAE